MDIAFVARTRQLAALGAALLLPIAVRAAQSSGSVRLSTGLGADSNARRDYEQFGTQADAFAFATGLGHLQIASKGGRAAGDYELGVRKFLQLSAEDVLVQALTAEGALLLGKSWAVGIDGRGKDRRGGNRDYSDLSAAAFMELAASNAIDLRAEGGARRFIYRPVFAYSFKATEFTAQARYRFNRKHTVALIGELGFRFYNDDARADPRRDSDLMSPQRQDTALLAGLVYSYRGPFALTLSYSFGGADSNSFGETFYRHRAVASIGARLPWDLTLLGQVAIQTTRYPDGPYASPDLILLEDDNQNAVSVKLLRPLSNRVDGELRFALYHASLPQNGLTYLRQVAWMGFTWRL